MHKEKKNEKNLALFVKILLSLDFDCHFLPQNYHGRRIHGKCQSSPLFQLCRFSIRHLGKNCRSSCSTLILIVFRCRIDSPESIIITMLSCQTLTFSKACDLEYWRYENERNLSSKHFHPSIANIGTAHGPMILKLKNLNKRATVL
jgi:hypothetical protein